MITRDNYEAFYLDYLEGTLSPEVETLFLAFLEANQDLQLDDDFLPTLESETEGLSALDKQLLKKSEEIAPISLQTIDYYLIAELEGLLTTEQQARLTDWIQEHPAYVAERKLYQHTIATPIAVTFSDKSKLKQKTRIVPLWVSSTAAAASVALLISLGLNTRGENVNLTTPRLDQFALQHDSLKPTHQKNGVQYNHKLLKQNGVIAKAPKKNGVPEFIPEFVDQEYPTPSPRVKDNGPTLLPEQPIAYNPVSTHSDPQNGNSIDGNYVAWQGMTNPIQPITTTLSDKLNTTIDFRRQKETPDKQSGFYLRIGKFEFMHKKGGKNK